MFEWIKFSDAFLAIQPVIFAYFLLKNRFHPIQ